MARYYKTLFEVKLMHEYFLTRQNGETPFRQAQPARLRFLLEDYSMNRETVSRDIQFEFMPGLLSFYPEADYRILPANSGFRVVAQVLPVQLPDNSIVYKPVRTVVNSPGFIIHLSRNNTEFISYTNERVGRSIPTAYFFTNETRINQATPPYLTAPVPALDPQYRYEQGELARSAGSVRWFYRGAGTDNWALATGDDFANENDRLLTGPSFRYSFLNGIRLSEAVFKLKDDQGIIISELIFKNNTPFPFVTLNYSEEKRIVYLESEKNIEAKLYTLEVTGSDNFSASHKLIFTRKLTGKEWGVTHIQFQSPDPAFNLLAPDGFLITRTDAAGVKTPHPVFEINISSRAGFLRYLNAQGNDIDLVPELQGHLEKRGRTLVSLMPKIVSLSNYELTKPDQTTPLYVPQPENYEIQKDDMQRNCFDVRVPESDMFPLV